MESITPLKAVWKQQWENVWQADEACNAETLDDLADNLTSTPVLVLTSISAIWSGRVPVFV